MKLNCELTQDLLPLYTEGLLQEGNRKLVQEHLDTCEGCRSLLGELKTPAVEVRHEANGLKEIRKGLRLHTFTVATFTAFAVVFIALMIWSCFISGSDALGYAAISMYIVMPLVALICNLLMGLRQSVVKWGAPFIFATIASLIPLFVFQYTEFGFFVFVFLCAMAGCVIGHVIRLICSRRKKRAARAKIPPTE